MSEHGTDWDYLDRVTDGVIARAVASDPDAAPILDERFWANAAGIDRPRRKVSLTIRLDFDTYEWFRATGKGYQTRMNGVLGAYAAAQKTARKPSR